MHNTPLIGITTDIEEKNFYIETAYAKAIAKAGGIPVLIPSIPEYKIALKDIITQIDGLLLPGSTDMDPKFYGEKPHPEIRPLDIIRTQAEYIVLEESLNKNKPVLGICGGMQLINVFFGGSLYQDIHAYIPEALNHEKGAVHKIKVEADTELYNITQRKTFSVKSHHHQSVKEVGKGLEVSAKSPDGIIEGIETNGSFVLGIQWHPELENTKISERIFKKFIENCKNK